MIVRMHAANTPLEFSSADDNYRFGYRRRVFGRLFGLSSDYARTNESSTSEGSSGTGAENSTGAAACRR